MSRHGMMRNPALLALLALSAGCPDDPEPAGTGPDCKKGECPVDQPLPDDPPIATPAPAPAPMSRSVGSTWSERRLRGGTDVIDEASHAAPVAAPAPHEAVPARAPTEPSSLEPTPAPPPTPALAPAQKP